MNIVDRYRLQFKDQYPAVVFTRLAEDYKRFVESRSLKYGEAVTGVFATPSGFLVCVNCGGDMIHIHSEMRCSRCHALGKII